LPGRPPTEESPDLRQHQPGVSRPYVAFLFSALTAYASLAHAQPATVTTIDSVGMVGRGSDVSSGGAYVSYVPRLR